MSRRPPPTPREGLTSYVRRPAASDAATDAPLVLVVDDGVDAREMYCACLEFHGFRTAAAGDGCSGLETALAATPDAVVLDFSMPRMDGAQVLRRLKDDPRTRHIPVVMLTAVPELVEAGVRAECAAFLEKPCDPDRLVETVAAAAGRESSGAARASGRRARM